MTRSNHTADQAEISPWDPAYVPRSQRRVRGIDHHPTHRYLVTCPRKSALHTDARAAKREQYARLTCLLAVLLGVVKEGAKMADWAFVALAVVETPVRMLVRRS